MTPGTVIDLPASCAVRVRIKALKPNLEARAALGARLDTYSGPHAVRKLFKAAVMALDPGASPLSRATIRYQLLNLDKRHNVATRKLAMQAAKMMVSE